MKYISGIANRDQNPRKQFTEQSVLMPNFTLNFSITFGFQQYFDSNNLNSKYIFNYNNYSTILQRKFLNNLQQ